MKNISTSFFKVNNKQILFVLFLFIFSVSYSQTYDWAKSISCSGADVGYSIAEDGNGNVFITGYFSGATDFDPSTSNFIITSSSLDAFLAKYDNEGNFLWVKQLGGFGNDAGREIYIDKSGNIFLTGYFSETVNFNPSSVANNLTSVGGYDVFLTKYNNDGNCIWAKSMGSNGNDYGIFFDFDSFGNIYLTGDFNGNIDLDPSSAIDFFATNGGRDAYIAKYDSNGNYIFGKTFGGNGDDSGQCIRVDDNDDFYLTGNFFNTVDFDPSAKKLNFTAIGEQDFFLSKFDSKGSLIFAKTMGSNEQDYSKHLYLDSSFSPVICGYFCSNCDFDPSSSISQLISLGNEDLFIAKYTSTGNYSWAKSVGSQGFEYALSLTINSDNDIFVGGFFENTADFDPSTNIYNLTSQGSSDAFFAKYDSNGSLIFAKNISGIGQNRIYSIYTNSLNAIYVTGFFNSTADFNPSELTNNLTSAGDNEIFIGKYIDCKKSTEKLILTDTLFATNDTALILVDGADYYSWNINNTLSCYDCNNPIATLQKDTYYAVKASFKDERCPIYDSVLVKTNSNNDFELIIPNVFSPNTDNVNDFFTIKSISSITNYECLIYNRWGKKVFNGNDIKNSWDGNIGNNMAPDGQYFYIITIESSNSTKKKFNGVVSLIR